ncbi:hypothetical protein TNCV_2932961 [Trichonephila clavipes]|nr:hypothetical protein TNCV_2932961 [Trichonephila clavipes]
MNEQDYGDRKSVFHYCQSFASSGDIFGTYGFVNGILETGGVMDKCVQMWTRNYGALGQTARVCFGVLCANRKKEVKRDFGDEKTGEKKSEREKEEKRARKREGLIVGGRGEENPRVLLGDADQEFETRMRKNALRTGRRQAVE